jgi:hypothetical protein
MVFDQRAKDLKVKSFGARLEHDGGARGRLAQRGEHSLHVDRVRVLRETCV